MRRYLRADLLLIDDFAVLSMDPAQAKLAFQVISERYDYPRSTCINTNRPFKDWPKVFPDALNAQVIAERLTARALRALQVYAKNRREIIAWITGSGDSGESGSRVARWRHVRALDSRGPSPQALSHLRPTASMRPRCVRNPTSPRKSASNSGPAHPLSSL